MFFGEPFIQRYICPSCFWNNCIFVSLTAHPLSFNPLSLSPSVLSSPWCLLPRGASCSPASRWRLLPGWCIFDEEVLWGSLWRILRPQEDNEPRSGFLLDATDTAAALFLFCVGEVGESRLELQPHEEQSHRGSVTAPAQDTVFTGFTVRRTAGGSCV